MTKRSHEIPVLCEGASKRSNDFLEEEKVAELRSLKLRLCFRVQISFFVCLFVLISGYMYLGDS